MIQTTRRTFAILPGHLKTYGVQRSLSTSFTTKLPGISYCVLGSASALMLSEYFGKCLLSAQNIAETSGVASPISAIPLALMIGLFTKNILPESYTNNLVEGAAFASKTFLQVGIVCIGIKLSALEVFSTGLIGIPVVITTVGTGLYVIPKIGKKLGLPDKMSYLITAGTSICGITAISALSPAIKAEKSDTSFAIANVVTFGTISLLTYPYIAHTFLTSSEQIGILFGCCVHDTSQVVGTALTYHSLYDDEIVLKIATVTKLTRNILLAGAIPYLTIKAADPTLGEGQKKITLFEQFKQHTPTFVYGFLLMSLLRTTGDYYLLNTEQVNSWNTLIHGVGTLLGTKLLIGTAMTGIGFGTSLNTLQGVGPKPFLLGFLGASVVSTTGLFSSFLFLKLLL